MISLSRRATVASAALLVSAVGAGLVNMAPAASAATTPTVTAGTAVGQGATDWPLTVTGTGLTADTVVSFTKTGTVIGAGAVDKTDIVVDTSKPAILNSTTSLTVYVNVPANAAKGQLDIVVTNASGTGTCYPGLLALGSVADPGCQALDAAPGAPTFTAGVGVGAVGHSTPFTTSGLLAGATLKSSTFATAPVTVTSATAGTAALTIPPSTTPGSKSVTLINGDGGQSTGTVNVTAPPTLTAVAPTTADAGATVSLTVTGSFETSPAATVSIFGTPETVTNPTASSLTVSVAIPAGTPAGPTPVTVINGDGGSSTAQSLFSVIGAPDAPQVVTETAVGDGTATVLWQPVADADDGGAPIYSYDVTTSPDTGSHIVLASSPPSVVLNGLTDGTSYTATVSATNRDPVAPNLEQTGPGTTSPAFTPVNPNAQVGTTGGTLPTPTVVTLPKVTLKASKTTITFASPLTISGKALLSGAPLAHTVVDLQSIASNGVRTDTGTNATTGSDGSFTFKKIFPSYTTTFGIGVGSNTTTAGIKVTVTQYLVLLKQTLSASSRTLMIAGLGTPGTTSKKATAELFKVTKTGHRVGALTKTTLAKGKAAKGYSAGVSTFTLKTTLNRGTYLVAVAILGTPTNGPVQSKPFTIKVP